MQRKTYICIALMLLVSCFVTVLVFAHGGRTDANGGHYDRSTGEYHYHHGYPAHQHANGVCPYDYDDKTNHPSGGSSGKDTTRKETQKESETLSWQEWRWEQIKIQKEEERKQQETTAKQTSDEETVANDNENLLTTDQKVERIIAVVVAVYMVVAVWLANRSKGKKSRN